MFLSLRLPTEGIHAQRPDSDSQRNDILGIQPLQRLALPRLVRHPDAHPPLERVCGIDDAAKGDAQRGPHHRVCVPDRELREANACQSARTRKTERAEHTWTSSQAAASPIFTSALSTSKSDVSNLTIRGAPIQRMDHITPRASSEWKKKTTYMTSSTPSSASTFNRWIADPEIVWVSKSVRQSSSTSVVAIAS